MKKFVFMVTIVFCFLGLAISLYPKPAAAYSRVSGYYRSSGTYIQPYYRSTPNAYKWDNYSYKSYQPRYNSSYYFPTKNYSSSWYTPDYSYSWKRGY